MLSTGALLLPLVLTAPPGATVSAGAVQAALDLGPEEALPEGSSAQDAASSGTTDLDTQGKFADAAERQAANATELEIAAGALASTGNARFLQTTGTGHFRIRRGRHQFATAGAANFGRAAADVDSPVETTISNVQGMVRYDFFFATRWSAFLMTTGRNDRFQGLDLRANVDPGVAFYALTDPKHRLWFELGYDFQYDNRRTDSIFSDVPVNPDEPDGATMRVQVVDEIATNHAARLFAGYSNQLSDLVSFHTGAEYLQSLLDGKRIRVNWASALTANLANRLGLATTFTMRFENQPLPGVRKLDTITAILLTVKFM